MCLGQQTNLYGQQTKRKPFKGFDLWKLLCRYSGRDFKESSTPLCIRVYTTEGVYTFPAGNENYCFEGAVKNG